MPRPRLTRDQLLQRAQRAFPVRMNRAQVVDVAIAHIDTLNDIATGRGTFASLRDLASNALTWYRAAELMGLDLAEMTAQRELVARLAERFERTGHVAFTGPDYQLAKHGVEVMDAMAQAVPRAIALDAIAWSTAMLIELYGPAYGTCDDGDTGARPLFMAHAASEGETQ